MSWALVITIISGGLHTSSVAVHSVDMQSKEACLAAASFYTRTIKTKGHIVNTTCISKGDK